MSASKIALPPTYLHGERPTSPAAAVVCCCEAGQLRAVCFGGLSRVESPPAVFACSVVQQAVFCLLAFTCHAHCPHQHLAPVQFCFAPVIPFCFFACHLFIPCAPGSSSVRASSLLGPAVCKLQDCPVGSCNTGLQWRPVHRSI